MLKETKVMGEMVPRLPAGRVGGLLAAALSVLLVAGCSDDKQQTSDVKTAPEPITTTQPKADESATEKARAAVQEASQSVKKAASAVAEKVEVKAVEAKENLTEMTAGVVEKAADKVAEVAGAVEAATTAADSSAEKTYQSVCFSCHDFGVAGAPKPGDKPAWEARLGQGVESLYASALNGKGAMPAKGGNASLSDAEVKAVVDYMIAESH